MAAKRKHIGLVFGIDNRWIAGSYYIMNVVKALNTLPDSEKPHIVFLSNTENKNAITQLSYPYYSIRNPYQSKRNYAEAGLNKILKLFMHKDIINKQLSDKHISALFPASNEPVFDKITNKIFWIPDFQHHYYPNFFSQEEIKLRNNTFRQIAQSNNTLVLSSQSALMDFKQFYPNASVKIKVVPFAVTHPGFSTENITELKQKYDISKPYYIVTNQFWQHKNHKIILQALNYLIIQNKRINFQIVFTGKADDYRAPGFYNQLMQYVKEKKIENHLRFIGFIPRSEQLKLMQKSIAIIQPSLFEGWSTVVEDAKALNQFILLSDIPVHKEQNPLNVTYFNANKPEQLAALLEKHSIEDPNTKYYNYSKNCSEFGKKLKELFNS